MCMDDQRSRRGWQWLLIVPVVVPLLTFLYNGKDPRLFGFPRFYWLQLAFILLGVATAAGDIQPLLAEVSR